MADEDPEASRDNAPSLAELEADSAPGTGEATPQSAPATDSTTDNAVADEANHMADAVHEQVIAAVEDPGKPEEVVSEHEPEALESELAALPAEAPVAEAFLATGDTNAPLLEEAGQAAVEEAHDEHKAAEGGQESDLPEAHAEDLPPAVADEPLPAEVVAVEIDIPPGAIGLKLAFVFPADNPPPPAAEEADPDPEEPADADTLPDESVAEATE